MKSSHNPLQFWSAWMNLFRTHGQLSVKATAKCTHVLLLHSGLGVCCSFERVVTFFTCLHGRWDYPYRKITYKNTPHQNGVRQHVGTSDWRNCKPHKDTLWTWKPASNVSLIYFPVALKALCHLENKFSSQKVTGKLMCSSVVQHVPSMYKVLGSISSIKERRKKEGQKDRREGRKEEGKRQVCR